jgi:hypothetical protein
LGLTCASNMLPTGHELQGEWDGTLCAYRVRSNPGLGGPSPQVSATYWAGPAVSLARYLEASALIHGRSTFTIPSR